VTTDPGPQRVGSCWRGQLTRPARSRRARPRSPRGRTPASRHLTREVGAPRRARRREPGHRAAVTVPRVDRAAARTSVRRIAGGQTIVTREYDASGSSTGAGITSRRGSNSPGHVAVTTQPTALTAERDGAVAASPGRPGGAPSRGVRFPVGEERGETGGQRVVGGEQWRTRGHRGGVAGDGSAGEGRRDGEKHDVSADDASGRGPATRARRREPPEQARPRPGRVRSEQMVLRGARHAHAWLACPGRAGQDDATRYRCGTNV